MLTLPAVHRVRLREALAALAHRGPEAAAYYMVFEIPKGFEGGVTAIFRKAEEASGGYLHLTIGTPRRPRTPRQQRASRGWCADIAEQLAGSGLYLDKPVAEIAQRVYEAMKRLAVSEGSWPTRISPIDGQIEAESQSLASIEQVNSLLSIIKRYADENGLWLTEIGEDGEARRCIGGKPIEAGE